MESTLNHRFLEEEDVSMEIHQNQLYFNGNCIDSTFTIILALKNYRNRDGNRDGNPGEEVRGTLRPDLWSKQLVTFLEK